MNNRIRRLAYLAIILLVVVGIASNNVLAQGPGGNTPLAPTKSLGAGYKGPSQLRKPLTGTQTVLVALSGPTLAEYSASEGSATLEQSSFVSQLRGNISLFSEQASFALAAKAAGVKWTEVNRLHTALNGIIMKVDASQLTTIAHLPGVKQIYFGHPMYKNDNAGTLFVGSQASWSRSYTGVGVKVGVIDTGIDYTHKDFGGTGVYCANPGQGTCGFPTAKVVGGYNFQTDDGSVANDPLDRVDGKCGGEHGTHVAGTVAGFGVTTGGATYTGTYNPLPAISNFSIQPGVAPNAKLYAYRVFSCTNSSASVDSLTLANAVDRAVADHVNIIQMSIGGDYNNDQDPFEIEFNNAAAAGVVAAVAAGNAGDTYYISGTSMTSVLAVAASSANGPASLLASVTENAPNSGQFGAATAAFGGPGPVTGNLVYVPANPGDGAHDACGNPPVSSGGTSYLVAGSLTGKIALIDRGTCAFQTKAGFAEAAGAIGVVIVNNRPGVPQAMGGDPASPPATIPTVMVSNVDGASLKTTLGTGTLSVTIAPPGTGSPSTADTLAGFSSRGPGINLQGTTTAAKPDISAPGLAITSAQAGSGNGALTIQGTSMATPHVSGALADLKQARPGWSVTELKAALMNYANHDISYGINGALPLFGLTRQGTGRLDIDAATAPDSKVVAFQSDKPVAVTVSFGVLGVTTNDSKTITRNVTVRNKGDVTVKYNIAFTDRNSIPGVTYSVSPSSITVNPHSDETVKVTLKINFAGVTGPHTADSTIAFTQGGFPRAWISEASGLITFTPTSGSTHAMRLGVWSSVRPSSDVHNVTPFVRVPNPTGTSLSFQEKGTALNTGTGAFDEVGLRMPFQLIAKYSTPPATINNVMEREAELKYLGFSTTYTGGAVADANVYFGLSSRRDWSSPNEVQYQVYIFSNPVDAANLTNPQFVLYNGYWSQPSGDPSDGYVSWVADGTGNPFDVWGLNLFTADQFDMQLLNSNTMVLTANAGEIGLSDTQPVLYYRVLGVFQAAAFNPFVFDSGALSLDVSKPVYAFPNIIELDTPGNGPYSVTYNMNNKKLGAKAPDILMLHFQNFGADARAEIVHIYYSGPDVGLAAANPIKPAAAPTFVPSGK